MITIGVDLAAEAKKTALARLEWQDGRAVVTELCLGVTDDQLVEHMTGVDKVGIDCPLGWPEKFIDFVTRHRDDQITITPDAAAAAWRKELRYRTTDLWVKDTLPSIQGLSVSTDRIGVTTMRCAALLSMLAARGARVNRSGSGIVTEVYPAASLARWGLPHKGYKRKQNAVQLSALVDSLLQSASWLDLGDHMQLCRDSDDAFDAVVAAITAGAAALGQVEPIPDAHVQVASVEGGSRYRPAPCRVWRGHRRSSPITAA